MGRDRHHLRLGPPRTVRSQVTLLAATLVAVVLAVTSIGLVAAQRRVLTHGIDEILRQRADNVEGDVEAGTYGSRLPTEGDPEDAFLQLLDPDGAVVASSDNAADLPAATTPVRPGVRERIQTVEGLPLSDGQFRVLRRRVLTLDGARTLVAAKNLDDVRETARILATLLVAAIPIVTVLLAVLVWWLTGRVLRPVEEIRAEVARIQGTDLHRRVPSPGTHDEIARLAATMNAMLDRVETATERQRRFVADASHELRNPLTRIRSTLEVSLAHPETDPEDLRRSLLADTIDLQRLVDDLLFLARAESGALDARRQAVDLDDLVLAEARRLRDRGVVEVDAAAVSAARTVGDPHQLVRAIQNLASNAERHAHTRVRFELREEGEQTELVVADDGPGIPDQHHETVFKRFTRLDEARSRDAGGAGLGLAIVHDIVSRHGGTIAIASANGDGARLVMHLPKAP